MAVGIEVSILAGCDVLDPADLVAALSSPPLPGDLQIGVVGTSVRIQAQRPSTLGEVAGPLVGWWQAHRPQAVLRLDAAGGDLRITSTAGDCAGDIVRHFIEHESGPIRATDDAVGDERPTRRGRPRSPKGFTARVVGISRDNGILSVGVAEDRLGTGRSPILQGVDPTSASGGLIDPDDLIDQDEAAYCLVTETAATVYGGLTAIALHDGTLRIQLTRTAAKTRGCTIPTERMYSLSLGSRQGNAHLHWHLAPCRPGVPYDKQQFHAVMAENGILSIDTAIQADLADRIRSNVQ